MAVKGKVSSGRTGWNFWFGEATLLYPLAEPARAASPAELHTVTI
jgi:hypothetical protein